MLIWGKASGLSVPWVPQMGPSWVMELSSAPNSDSASACCCLEAWAPAPAGFGCFRLSQAFVKTQIFKRHLRFVTDLGKGCIQVTFFLEEETKQQCECHIEAHTAMPKSSHVCAWLLDVLYPQISVHYKCKSIKAGMSIQPQNVSVYIPTCCGEPL